MAGSDSGNAMTEIALALAMAFFAIVILTMVLMDWQGQVKDAGAETASDAMRVLAPTAQKIQKASHRLGGQTKPASCNPISSS